MMSLNSEAGDPATIRSALHLIHVTVGVLIVGLVGLFFWHDTIRLGIEREHPSWGSTRVSAEVLTHQAGAAVFAVLLVVFWLRLVDRVERSWRWTPAAALALAAVGAGGALQVALDDAFPAAAKIGLGIGAALGVIGAALLWEPRSRSYFDGQYDIAS